MKRHRTFQGFPTGLAVLLVCCILSTGCGRSADNDLLPDQTDRLPESTESTESMESAKSTESTESESSLASEPAKKAFRYDPEIATRPVLPSISEKAARDQGRDILTFMDVNTSTGAASFTEKCVTAFNKQSEKYYIVLQNDTPSYGVALGTARDRLLVELMAGKGPDIFYGALLPSPNNSILDQGILLDLAPMLDALGITDEDYFPAARVLAKGEHVYGFAPYLMAESYAVLDSVLDGREQPDIYTLVEQLYSYPDQTAVWWPGASYRTILKFLLGGSEDCWGMVDWESGRCDFSGEFFAKVLEVAKRYQDPDMKGSTRVISRYEPGSIGREDFERSGKVILDFPFGDGWYPYCRSSYAYMVNGNTKYPEGVQEFLQFVFGEQGQNYAAAEFIVLPVSRDVAASYWALELDLKHERYVTIDGELMEVLPTEEMMEADLDYAGRARYLPVNTAEIQSIILEEVGDFINGSKSLEMVCELIQNRVQLYLDENS